MVLVRQEIGDVLRDFRLQKGRTLRQVASKASVALGYLSEVERGQKEASSEILASVAEALDTPISVIMREVGDRLAVIEGLSAIPDTLPDELVAQYDSARIPSGLVASSRLVASRHASSGHAGAARSRSELVSR
jgi:transcriptional regulator with XRE-family HTH domain